MIAACVTCGSPLTAHGNRRFCSVACRPAKNRDNRTVNVSAECAAFIAAVALVSGRSQRAVADDLINAALDSVAN